MSRLPFRPFDADNHYYEATDAFTRHLPKAMAKRAMQWATIDGRQRLLVGGKVNRFIPNPTFDPVSKPGALDEYFRGRNPKGQDIRAAFGELEPISPAYRDRASRVALMAEQGLQGAFLFPTLGVGMEEALRHDVEALHVAFHAFNQWLDEDWAFAGGHDLYAAPMLSLADPAAAVAELDDVLERGARLVCLRAAPVPTASGHTRSPGDPVYDPFWARLAEAGVVAAYHSGDSGYGRYLEDWEPAGEMEAFRFSPMRTLTGERAIFDTMAVLVTHGVFARHSRLRVATIESGSDWVAPLLKKLAKAYGQQPWAFAGDPVEAFRTHVWVAPFYEDDIRGLVDAVGVDHVLFGSDFPHAEGLADPLSFVDDLHGFSDEEVRRIMRDNAYALAHAGVAS